MHRRKCLTTKLFFPKCCAVLASLQLILFSQILPMTNEVVANEMSCFQVDGGADGAVEAQSVLPDISDFELVGAELKTGCDCTKYQKVEEIGGKVNRYTIWLQVVEGVTVPHHYEMKGKISKLPDIQLFDINSPLITLRLQ